MLCDCGLFWLNSLIIFVPYYIIGKQRFFEGTTFLWSANKRFTLTADRTLICRVIAQLWSAMKNR